MGSSVKVICADITESSTCSDLSGLKVTHPDDTKQTGSREAGDDDGDHGEGGRDQLHQHH